MAEVIRMPRLSDTMEEGTLVGWQKKVGDRVNSSDVIAEVETDKATMEIRSFEEGTLLHIEIEEGAVPVNGLIAIIGKPGEDITALLAKARSGESTESAAPAEAEKEAAATPASPTPSAVVPTATDERIKATPVAKALAADAGINIGEVEGTGPNGRITKKDVTAHMEQPAATAPVAAPAPSGTAPAAPTVPSFQFNSGGDNYTDTPVSQMRKVIARRLGESKFTAPHFYLTVEIDMETAISTRQRINEIAPVKVSYNDLVVKASAVALRQHPIINSSWLGDKIRHNGNINIGVAVAVPDGLLVPVIRHADMKSLSQINTEVKELAGKAKDRKLQPNEMEGNTFTISNLGMFNIEEFTAIINPPDACILAVGGIIEKPVVKNGEIVVGNRMKVTLSCDHRVVDGASGAKFLNTLKELLEDPIRLLV